MCLYGYQNCKNKFNINLYLIHIKLKLTTLLEITHRQIKVHN